MESVTSVQDVRRDVFRVLLEEGRLLQNSDSKSFDCSDVLKTIVKNIVICPKVEQLTGEINQLKNVIDTMRNTLSWRISSPLRNSRLLKMILSKFRILK